MKNFYLILLSVFAFLNTAMAQELKVKSFGVAINDLSASVETVPDKNGDPCALVKILLVDSIAKVEGFVLKTKSVSPTEKWVYLSSGAKEVRIMPTHYKPINVYFPDFGVKGVDGKRTYILDLDGSNFASVSVPISLQSAKPMSTPSGTVITIPVKDGISIEMVKVEAGSFNMGALYDEDDIVQKYLGHSGDNEAHRVILTKNYFIGKYEVTQALWKVVMGGKTYGDNNEPKGFVSWKDCQKFISKLNILTGKQFRLPTEAEWEYAARGGKKSCGYKYSGGNSLYEVAWSKGNSGSYRVVGTRKPNELGIYDMSGNVSEWCYDWYGSYSSLPQANPTGADSGSYRVMRGGSFAYGEVQCKPSTRSYKDPNSRNYSFGFRLVLAE